MANPDAPGPAEPDSLDSLADALGAEWRTVMAPIAAQIVTFLNGQPDLPAARDQLAGLLPQLNTEALEKRVGSAGLQARLAGLYGVPVLQAEDQAADFAEAGIGRVDLKPLADAEAVRFLSQKQVGARFSFDWRDVRDEEHVSSFVVAKAMKTDLLKDIHGELVNAVANGGTREQFVRDLTPILQKHGWWGRQQVVDPTTGETQLAQLGSPQRLRTIYDVNVRMAHAAGKWERISRVARPGDLLRYVAVLDDRTRDQHRAWHGTVLPPDDPFWQDHYPPNGWNCRCTAVLVMKTVAKASGLQATTPEELEAKGYGETVPWFNKRTGETEQIPKGIDPGFASNVGQSRLRAFTPGPDGGVVETIDKPGRQAVFEQAKDELPPLPDPRHFVGKLIDEVAVSDEDAVAGFVKAFASKGLKAGEGELVFTDAAQVPLVISADLFRDKISGELKVAKRGRKAFLNVLAQTVLDPDEIWVAVEEVRNSAGQVSHSFARRYIARWTIAGMRQEAMMVVFEENGDTWTGVTAYPPGMNMSPGKQGRQLESQGRRGVMIWRRK